MTPIKNETIEFTILMPCLNEYKTLAICIEEASAYIQEHALSAEILIADNGSTDGSYELAEQLGDRVVRIDAPGYGNALIGGIRAARGTYIIMGDCDYSYDFYHIDAFIQGLRDGYDLVIGNRFQGQMESGAMPFSHKYLGVPFLSWVGRLRYHTFVGDFHCGLRGCSAASAKSMNFTCSGMEFASEMIGAYALHNCSILEVPINLRCDKRGGPSHLHSISDGLRHLRYMLTR